MTQQKKSSLKIFYAKHPIISHFILIFLTGCIIVWVTLIFLDSWTMHGEDSVVPEIKHMSYEEARAVLQANKLEIEISDSIYDRNLAPGTVVESWPSAGAVVKEGRQVYVSITAFSPKQITVSMPLANSVSIRQAMSYLRAIGITDIRIIHVPSEYPDLVLGARYGDTPLTAGSVIPVTSTITLEVGSAPDPFETDSISNIEGAVESAFNSEEESLTEEYYYE